MTTLGPERKYIDDFCEDLNHRGVILYIGNVDPKRLLNALTNSMVNKVYRLEYALTMDDPSMRNYIYVSNCDLQDLSYPVYEYIEEGYDVHVLYEDGNRYYVKEKV
jgi:hypothetical protein